MMRIKKPAIICLLMLLMMFAGCSSGQKAQDIYKGIEPFYVDTPYCELQFPEKWESNISTKTVSKDGCDTIQYWATVNAHEKIHLFDVNFGGSGYYVGSIKAEKNIDIYVVSYNIEIDDTWTDEERNTIYAIADDINYLLVKLEEIEGFEPVE